MAWLTQWWMFVVTAAVLFLPGLAASWALGLRRLGAWAFAPVGSVAMISLTATVFGFARIPWTALTAVVGLAVVAAALIACRMVLRIRPSRAAARGRAWPVPAAMAIAAVLLGIRVTVYIGDPANFSQTNDASFHLGAVRAIIDHGVATSFGLAGLIDPAALGGFYPGAWHATDSLIVMLSGGSIAVATNVLALVVATVVWTLGITWLTQVTTGRRLVAAAAAAMSPIIVIFPLELLQYGVLYAYFIAAALLPAAIAAVVAVTGERAGDGPVAGRVVAIVLAVGMGAAAIGNAQPSVVLSFGLALWLYAAGGVIRQWRNRDRARWWGSVGLVAAGLVLTAAWWLMGRSVTAGVWSAVRGGADAAVEILSAGFVKTPPAWWVAVLLFVGLFALIRRGGPRWLGVAWAAYAFLAFVAYAVNTEAVRLFLVGPWYSDPYRLAALVPTVMIPVAAIGAVYLADLLAEAIGRRSPGGRASDVTRMRIGVGAVALLLVIAVVAVATQPLVLRYKLMDGFAETQSPYVVNENAWLDPDERALLLRLDEDVPDGAVVLANPHTGAALAYFLTGVDVFPAKWQVPRDVDYGLVKNRLHDAATDPEVCDAVRALDAQYVLDFGLGDQATAPGTVQQMPGFTDLEGVDGFELVDQQGDAKLWRITACD